MMSAGWAASARTKRKKLKIRDIEGLREKIFQPIGFGFAAQVDQHQLHVSAKLPENLPAGAAAAGEGVGWLDNVVIVAGASALPRYDKHIVYFVFALGAKQQRIRSPVEGAD